MRGYRIACLEACGWILHRQAGQIDARIVISSVSNFDNRQKEVTPWLTLA